MLRKGFAGARGLRLGRNWQVWAGTRSSGQTEPWYTGWARMMRGALGGQAVAKLCHSDKIGGAR
jgi:hypothetical protein